MSDRSDLHQLEIARTVFRFANIGGIVNSALYLSMVFIVGVMFDLRAVVMLAIMAAGATYASYTAAVVAMHSIMAGNMRSWWTVQTLVALSIALGAAAGILLAVDLVR